MQFHPTTIDGAWTIEPEARGDDRGSFARVFCVDEFAAHGLDASIVQANVSVTARTGTIRGLHYQLPPHGESKYLRVERGAIQEMVIDLRPWSPTYRSVLSVELSATNRRGLYVPEGCANGFQVLIADTAVAYTTTAAHHPGAERGLRPDDPAFDLAWPLPIGDLSDKDRGWADFDLAVAADEMREARESTQA